MHAIFGRKTTQLSHIEKLTVIGVSMAVGRSDLVIMMKCRPSRETMARSVLDERPWNSLFALLSPNHMSSAADTLNLILAQMS